jgi:aspartate/methionine/tyrosine aminotransferase
MGKHFEETKSTGAIYAAITVKLDTFNNQIRSIEDFCKLLYGEQNILILPGIFFGCGAQFIRILIACNNEKVKLFC